jgi:hypothetical protein
VLDFQRLLTDSSLGIQARALASSVTRGVGDVELGLTAKLVDGIGTDAATPPGPTELRWRQAVEGIVRLGTGTLDSPADFTDLGTGDRQRDVEIRSLTDIAFGRHFWMTVVARYNRQLADTRTVRVAGAGASPYAPAWRERTVSRDLGDEIGVAVFPRITVGEAVVLTLHYGYRRKETDRYRGTFTAADLTGEPRLIDASALDIGTAEREHRFGGGAGYSTAAAWRRGAARVPLDIVYQHFQTTRGSGGLVPKVRRDEVQVRWYVPLFGR